MNHKFTPETIYTKKCLIIVSAKEHGIIYVTNNGRLTEIEHVDEHPQSYSDNEGFFFRSGNGQRLGSGAPLEVDKQHNIKRYIKAIGEEINTVIVRETPEAIIILEPEHLKGLVEEYLVNPTHIPVQTVAYGNFVHEAPDQIKDRIVSSLNNDTLNPADPASVKGEPNEEEKRKILQVGELLNGRE